MPNPGEGEVVVNPSSERKEATEQQLSILLQKITGQDMPALNETQVSEVLAQRRQIAEYVHEDRKRESYDAKFIVTAALAFVLVFSAIVLWVKPDVFTEVLSLIIGLLGGGAGGYGIGKAK